ncbi:SH3 domain-containing protein [Paeniglutamicibacter cryotolerans]|uniref:Uncharacterized protein YraI n=1 Tax=Paeniglutamicibacter cryotolerans TaxID=670079 RepID=A0A839QH81_9MICC|nr:SH3 domain-containing protein [Paeniglutamicibacter cryotolerans]MBB2995250.1 uncharacterized protein YraI [Paeniglutamicibacter cryotolerans]
MSIRKIAPQWLLAMALAAGLAGVGLGPVDAAAPLPATASQAAGRALAAAAKTATTIKTTANVNLRVKPGTQHDPVATLKKGTVVVATGKSSGKWWQVTVGNKGGWVSSTYLKTTPGVVKTGPLKPQVKPAAGSSRWSDGTQAIYAKANKTSKRLMAQTSGVKVKHLKTVGKWSYVQTHTGKGWIEESALVTSEAKAIGNSKTHRWTVADSHVRSGASRMHRSPGIIPANQKVVYIETAN